MRHALVAAAALALLGATPAPPPPKGVAAPAGLATDPTPLPSDAECKALPAVKAPFAFGPGEQLEFDLDALGAHAGKLYMQVHPTRDGALPVQVKAQTNTFFAKIRRVSGGGTSFLNPRTLRPFRYIEDTVEDEIRKYAEVQFSPKDHGIRVDYKTNDKPGHAEFKYANEGLDVAGAAYLVRQLPIEKDSRFCFDVYAIRRLWRLTGKAEAREHLSLPIGEFEAWHLSGVAVRMDDLRQRREVHIWISDDARRLPLVAMGVIDLGVVRATLSAYNRPKDKKVRAEGMETLKW
jgi:hypothetical protein